MIDHCGCLCIYGLFGDLKAYGTRVIAQHRRSIDSPADFLTNCSRCGSIFEEEKDEIDLSLGDFDRYYIFIYRVSCACNFFTFLTFYIFINLVNLSLF